MKVGIPVVGTYHKSITPLLVCSMPLCDGVPTTVNEHSWIVGRLSFISGPHTKNGAIDDINCSLPQAGIVPSVQNPHFKYYLGGRYIPGPLRVIKHFGKSNIGLTANEILGLTKMNWNSFDLYSQLPATVNSSNEIARIGKLWSKKEGVTYDYRYFI